MDAALQINFHYVEQEKSYKIINFSSYTIKAISNIPWIILSLVLLPFLLILFVPVANLMLWSLYRNLQKELSLLKKDIPDLSFISTRDGYNIINTMVLFMEALDKEIEPDAKKFPFKSIFNKFNKISAVLTEMRNNLSRALFVSANTTSLSEKEKESLDIMNDIWGDDSDQVYAHHTHHHLAKKLKTNGV
ncbi:MAG: hypothetical protein MUO72_02545 [Bacteroidales bacterium]|nr:hypothetical protein [Bacteroidales bacterium]